MLNANLPAIVVGVYIIATKLTLYLSSAGNNYKATRYIGRLSACDAQCDATDC